MEMKRVSITEWAINPNKLLRRTIWSSPQGKKACHQCKYWAPRFPDARDARYDPAYDPAIQESWEELTKGQCGNLRILAAYAPNTPNARSFFYCNFFEEKEKEDE